MSDWTAPVHKGETVISTLINGRMLWKEDEEHIILRVSVGGGTQGFGLREWNWRRGHLPYSALEDIAATVSRMVYDHLIGTEGTQDELRSVTG